MAFGLTWCQGGRTEVGMLVELYEVQESNKSRIAQCEHCEFIAVWTIHRWPSSAKKRKAAYACSQHVDTVLFDVQYGRAGDAIPELESVPEEESNL
jgi:hypothetical protein